MDNYIDYNFQVERLKRNIEDFTNEDKDFILKALSYGEKAHEGQIRNGTPPLPYYIHCIRVANTVIENFNILDKEAISGALLHDTIEDTEITYEDITTSFNEKTAEIVSDLTRDHEGDTEENKSERKAKEYGEIKKKDFSIQAIKSSDILDNMRSWKYIGKDSDFYYKLPRWSEEAKTTFIPFVETVNADMAKEMEDIVNESENK